MSSPSPTRLAESASAPLLPAGIPRVARRLLDAASAPLFATATARLLFGAFLLALCLFRASILIAQYNYTYDSFIFIDAAWRMIHGQTPSVDFYNPLGPAAFWVVSLPMRWGADAGRSMAVAQALFAGAVSLCGFRLALRRLPHLFAAGVSFFLLMLVLSPHNLGETPAVLTAAMLYNRVGFGILGLLILEATQAPAGGNPGRAEFLGGLCSGALCSILFVIKVTFFLASFPLLVVLLPYRRQMAARLRGWLVGAAAGAVLVALLIHGRFDAVLKDISIAGHAKHLEFDRAAANTLHTGELMLFLCLLGCMAAWFLAEERDSRAIFRPLTALAFIPLSSALMLTNSMGPLVPLMLLLGLLFAAEVVRVAPAILKRMPSLAPVAAALVLALLLPAAHFGVEESASLAYAAHMNSARFAAFAAAPIADLRSQQTEYVEYINDGLRLLEAHSPSSESVYALEFANPFSFGLHRPPSHGGATNLHYGFIYSDTSKPDPIRILGDADVIMVPKSIPGAFGKWQIVGLRKNYLPAVEAHYSVAAESQNWLLYRRNSR